MTATRREAIELLEEKGIVLVNHNIHKLPEVRIKNITKGLSQIIK